MSVITRHLAFLVFCIGVYADAGVLTIKYRPNSGPTITISSREQIAADVGNEESRKILDQYFDPDSPAMKEIRDRVAAMKGDVTVTIDGRTPTEAERKAAQVDPVNDPCPYWSCSGGAGIIIWHEHADRAVSTLAHEVSHSFMRSFYGKIPMDGITDPYGCDGMHSMDEITKVESAWTEGYAEYHGDSIGRSVKTDQLPDVCAAGPAGLNRDQVDKGGKCQPNTATEDWKTASETDLWASEAVNGLILKDIANVANGVPNGAEKIEGLITNGGYTPNLQEFLKLWCRTYPEDSPSLAAIVDANLNFTMSLDDLKRIFGDRSWSDILGGMFSSDKDPLATYLARRTDITTNKNKCPSESIPKIADILARVDNPPGGGTGGGGAGGYPTIQGGCFGNLPVTDGRPATYLDLLGKMIELEGAAGQAVTGAAGDALKGLETVAKIADKLNLRIDSDAYALGKNAGPLGLALDIISVGGKLDEVGSRCLIALASGSEQAFVDAINDGLKFAVSFIAGKLGELGGGALGGIAGSEGGPVGILLGKLIGGVLGGKAGEWLGGVLYDDYMKDWATKNIAEKLFDDLCPNKLAGGGGQTPGGSGTGGADGNNPGSGDPNNPSGGDPNLPPNTPIGSGTPQGPTGGTPPQPVPSDQTPGYKRDPNYKRLSK